MKKIICLTLILLLAFFVSAQEEITPEVSAGNEGDDKLPEEDLYEEEFTEIVEEDIYADIGDVELKGDAGLTPDSALYFLETFIEKIFVGDNPGTALKYKEEKILEVKEMIKAGNQEGAEKALERVEKYNEILKKEVTPELDQRVRESSKATKELLESFELEGEEWEGIQASIDENLKEEDRIALAAKISNKIKELCEALSTLDPLEYSKVCKTDDGAPRWKKDLDKKLTKEQEKEAKKFFKIMSECFQNPAECRCDDISIKPFAKQCNIIAPLAAKCDKGDEQACKEMENVEDPTDLLPNYLRAIMQEVEEEYGDAKHDLHIPSECVAEGALSREACMKVMFKVHAPPECLEALESGKIDPKNEHEAKQACEKIMFEIEAPSECLEAGLKDFRECERYMFKLDAPQECLDAGLTGSGRDDWKKCELIRFKLEAPKECLDEGITGEHRDDWKKCEVIRFKLDAPQECLDAGLTGEGRDDWKKCDAIRFELEAPQECLDAGIDPTDRRAWDLCKPIQFRAEAPQECLDAGITGEDRDDWKKCDVIKFKLEAHPDCLKAGLTGEDRRDWDKCHKIQFQADAPQECLDAGLDGSGRRDWDECNKIREDFEDKGERREDCDPDQLHVCDDGYCKCVSKEEYDHSQGHDDDYEESECKDGCSQECGDQNTDCVNDKCVCLGYGENGPPTEPEPEPEPEPEE